MDKSKRSFILALIMLSLTVPVPYFYYSRYNNSLDYDYNCLYVKGNVYARCVTENNSINDCHGYYYLVSKDIEDGIKVAGNTNSTCEAIIAGDRHFFTSTGKFIK